MSYVMSQVVIPLYLKHGRDFPNMLRGMFSFVVYDARDDRWVMMTPGPYRGASFACSGCLACSPSSSTGVAAWVA